jgi:hypothetical protein
MPNRGNHVPRESKSKCVRNLTTGDVRRVTNAEADQLTQDGWNFVPKSAWRADIRKPVVEA